MDSQGAKSVISEDMQNLTQGKEDLSNQIRGHKANISNPNTSEESKQNSAEAMQVLGEQKDVLQATGSSK
ncbi:hypothetical protein F5X68DRAFT_233553 [Plectosphaerella plurivora]|uniref:Uncharacterized protein n=1 Tax=Plectosphaerella plurivora TaxID=936078 RepID=A0A9P9A9V0_9PEZI|nr:hypothetical protein F5X68DRAFT_233553 [Plectosphaerella plurivora]